MSSREIIGERQSGTAKIYPKILERPFLKFMFSKRRFLLSNNLSRNYLRILGKFARLGRTTLTLHRTNFEEVDQEGRAYHEARLTEEED